MAVVNGKNYSAQILQDYQKVNNLNNEGCPSIAIIKQEILNLLQHQEYIIMVYFVLYFLHVSKDKEGIHLKKKMF